MVVDALTALLAAVCSSTTTAEQSVSFVIVGAVVQTNLVGVSVIVMALVAVVQVLICSLIPHMSLMMQQVEVPSSWAMTFPVPSHGFPQASVIPTA